MNCPMCEQPMGWESDHNSEDCGFDEGGAVLIYSCYNDSCDADMVTIYVN